MSSHPSSDGPRIPSDRTAGHRGDVVIRKRDPSDCLYLLYSGQLWPAEAGTELGPDSAAGPADRHLRRCRRPAAK